MRNNLLKTGGKLPASLCRYMRINDDAIKSLRENYLWFSNPACFNDPFDCYFFQNESIPYRMIDKLLIDGILAGQISPFIADDARERLIKNFSTPFGIRNQVQRTVNSFLQEKMFVCCMSNCDDEILLWSHYGDNHKGMSLVFDTKTLFVEYDNNVQGYKVEYTPGVIESDIFHDSDIEKILIEAALRKYVGWKYEKEYRYFNVLETRANECEFNPNALIGVIFGCKTTLEDKKRVRSVLGDSVTYSKCVMEERKYKIKIVPDDFSNLESCKIKRCDEKINTTNTPTN